MRTRERVEMKFKIINPELKLDTTEEVNAYLNECRKELHQQVGGVPTKEQYILFMKNKGVKVSF